MSELQALRELERDHRAGVHFASMAETVRESLQINRALQRQAQSGFPEFVVRTPKTNEERVIVTPSLEDAGKAVMA